jgi:hypothetical protein
METIMIKESAITYHNFGLSVIPINETKIPIGKWKQSQEKRLLPNGSFDNAYGVGIVCGKVSGNLEVIDIDCKYDLTGNLFNDYKKLINSIDKNILPKLVVEKSTNGGYHFLYRCSEIARNVKIASRPTIDSEREESKQKAYAEAIKKEEKEDKAIELSEKAYKNDTERVLLETRGEGGYVACCPTKGYEMVFGSFGKINEITPNERKILFDCARTFNSVYEKPYVKKESQAIIESNSSPFEEWNERGDVLDFLLSEGWTLNHTTGHRNFLLRPGGTGKWSAEYSTEKRLLYVWTKSTVFTDEKAYNPSQVLCMLKFNEDYSSCSKWLVSQGYGKFTQQHKKSEYKQPTVEYSVSEGDDDFSFLATKEDTDLYIEQKRNGTFKKGAKTGIPSLDKYWRFKEAQLDMILGHDNSGKSMISWFFSVLDCLFNDQYYIVFAGENKTGAVKCRLMEFYIGRSVKDMLDAEYSRAKLWVENHYEFIRNDELFTYQDMINIGKKMVRKFPKFRKFIIEPYNVLDKRTNNEHQYDYRAMLDLRLFIRKSGIGVLLNIHAASEALRKTYPKEHEWGGYVMPPNKSDAEGGGKFPNKADNFAVIHWMADHPTEKEWTHLHIQKIKEYETGGQRTNRFEPYKLKMVAGGCGFEDSYGFNPIADYWSKQGAQSSLSANTEFLKEEPKPISSPKESIGTYKEEWD